MQKIMVSWDNKAVPLYSLQMCTKDVIDNNFKPQYDSIMQTSTPDGSGENKWFPYWKPFNIL